jgi:hypothetical protein
VGNRGISGGSIQRVLASSVSRVCRVSQSVRSRRVAPRCCAAPPWNWLRGSVCWLGCCWAGWLMAGHKDVGREAGTAGSWPAWPIRQLIELSSGSICHSVSRLQGQQVGRFQVPSSRPMGRLFFLFDASATPCHPASSSTRHLAVVITVLSRSSRDSSSCLNFPLLQSATQRYIPIAAQAMDKQWAMSASILVLGVTRILDLWHGSSEHLPESSDGSR